MKKTLIILVLLSTIFSCKSKDQNEGYLGTWQEVQKKGNSYVFIDCGYERGIITVENDSIYVLGTMENITLKIDHIKNQKGEMILFIDKLEKSYYKFSWIDKKKGISKWEVLYNDTSSSVNYYIIKSNLQNIKKIKGNNKDCITNEDVGDVVNDSIIFKNGNKFVIEDENCISLKDRKNNSLFEKCLKSNIVHIRHLNGDFISLTFINGQNSMDIDFFNNGDNWLSKSVTFYKNNADGQIKRTQPLSINLKEFDFDNVAEKFEKINTNQKISLETLKSKEKLKNIDVYKIADILKAYPISKETLLFIMMLHSI